jgi:transcriptional regulator with XRE-family HTH domain
MIVDRDLRLNPEKLRRARSRKGLTQRALAGLADVRRATVTDIENGVSTARPETIGKFATALGVEPADIADLPEEVPA